MFHMFLSFLVPQLFVNLQIHPFRTGASHSAIDSHPYRFRTQSFSRSARTGGPDNIFSAGLEPTFGVPASKLHVLCSMYDLLATSYCHALAWHSSVMPLTALLSNLTHALINEYINKYDFLCDHLYTAVVKYMYDTL